MASQSRVKLLPVNTKPSLVLCVEVKAGKEEEGWLQTSAGHQSVHLALGLGGTPLHVLVIQIAHRQQPGKR